MILTAEDQAKLRLWLTEGNTPDELADQVIELLGEYKPAELKELLEEARS